MAHGLFPLRTAGFVGLTLSMYGMLEVDTAISPGRDRQVVLHTWMARYGRALLGLYGVEAIARGPFVEHDAQVPGVDATGRGRIFVMNHRSGLDVPLTLAFVEATIVSRADLARWPIIGMAARRVGTLFVDRSDKRSGASVIHAMCGAIERGRGVMVYPEGTTYSGDEVRPFRAGAFTAAERTGAEIVPIGTAFAGAGATFTDESFVDHMKRVSGTPHTRVGLVVGEPIKPGGDVKELERKARAAVQALVHQARALVGA